MTHPLTRQRHLVVFFHCTLFSVDWYSQSYYVITPFDSNEVLPVRLDAISGQDHLVIKKEHFTKIR